MAADIVLTMTLDDSGVVTGVKQTTTAMMQMEQRMRQTTGAVRTLEQAHESLGTKFRHIVTTMGALRFAAMDLHDLFLCLPSAILKSAGELERTQVLMTGLSKSLTEVGKTADGIRDFNFITNFAKTAPFDIKALSDSFVKLKTAGLEPANGSMKALVDSVARFGGNSDVLQRASIAMQQMAGKGVISMEELRQQLGEAIPTAMQAMADGMGVSMQELAKIVKTGTLEATGAMGKMLMVMEIDNAGSASKMMETWSGQLARLKTEWELTSKFIADNGFGDAAKDAVSKLTAALKTEEFRKFASDAGASLGRFASSMVSVAEKVIKMSDAITAAAQAFVAYKVLFSMIPSISNTLTTSYNTATAAVKANIAATQQDILKKQQVIVANAEVTAAAEAALRKQLAGYEMEMNASKMKTNFLIAEDMRLAAAIQARSVRGSLQNLGANMAANAADTAARAKIASINGALIASERTLALAIANTNAALATTSLAAAQAEAAKIALIRTNWLATASVNAFAYASRAAAGAMALLGGPIGLGIIALMGLVWWWGEAGRKAEESADRQRRAAEGLSDAKDLIDNAKAVMDARKKLNEQMWSLNEMIRIGGGGKSALESDPVKRQIEVVKKATSELAAAEKTNNDGIVAVREQEGRRMAQSTIRETDQAIKTIEEQKSREVAAITKKAEEALAGLDKNDKKATAIVAQQRKDQAKAVVDAYDKQVDVVKAAIDTANKKLLAAPANSTDADAAVQAGKDANEKLEAIQAARQGFIDRMNGKTSFKDPNAGGAGSASMSPIQKLIAKLRVEKAELDAALPGLLSTLGKADPVVKAMAKLDAERSSGLLDKIAPGKEKGDKKVRVGPTDAEFKEAQALTKQVAELNTLSKDIKDVDDRINASRPDHEAAMAFLANPLAGEVGKKTNQFEELVAKLENNPARLAELAKEQGISTKALLDRIKQGAAQAADIDLANSYRGLANDVLQMAPALTRANQILANPLGEFADSAEGDKFDKALAKHKKTLEDYQALSEEAKTKYNAIQKMLTDGKNAAVTIDTAKYAGSVAKDTRGINIGNIQDDKERARQQLELANDIENKKQAAALKTYQQIESDENKVEAVRNIFAANAVARAEKMRLELRTPIQKMADDWKNSMSQMDKATADWANGFMDYMMGAITSSEHDFKKFVASILTDMAKIQMKSMFGDMISNTMSSIGNFASGALGMGNGTAGKKEATNAVADASAAAGSKLMELANTTSTTEVAMNGLEAAQQLMQTTKTTAEGTLATSLATLTLAAQNASAALFSVSASSTASALPFANGGIMSSMGSMPLKKYAAGGIANSPQLALFGEGSMSEAYVPLPDGRSIPVTMTGAAGGGDSVLINITVNNTGQEQRSDSGASNQKDFYRGIAEKVKNLVHAEIIDQQRPGGVLYR